MKTTRRQSAPRRIDGELLDAVGLLAAVWTAIALGGAVAPLIGRVPALLASFGLSTALCVVDAAARRPAHQRRAPDRRWPERLPSVLYFFAGFSIAPALVLIATALHWWVGAWTGAPIDMSMRAGVGPAPHPLVDAPAAGTALLASLLLAPFFEEHLYRGRLLPALEPHFGGVAALCATSVLFALPHLERLATIGALLAGLLLGGIRLRTGRTIDCIAMHAGMNFAGCSLAGLAPVSLPVPSVGWGAVAAVGLWALARPPECNRLRASAKRKKASRADRRLPVTRLGRGPAR